MVYVSSACRVCLEETFRSAWTANVDRDYIIILRWYTDDLNYIFFFFKLTDSKSSKERVRPDTTLRILLFLFYVTWAC